MMAARLLASARVAAPRLTVLLPPCRAGAAMTLRLARPQTALASVLAATGAAVSQQPTAVPRHRAMSTSSSRDAGNATAVVDDVETASSLIRNVVGSEKVVVFSALYCPFCSGAKDIFSERNVPFTVFELDKGPAEYSGVAVSPSAVRQALHRDYNQRTIPAVFINGEFVGGYSETSKLVESGELEERLQANA